MLHRGLYIPRFYHTFVLLSIQIGSSDVRKMGAFVALAFLLLAYYKVLGPCILACYFLWFAENQI